MKLIIDIPEEKFNTIKSDLYGTFPAEMKEWGLEAIRNGTSFETVNPCDDAISRQAVDDYIARWMSGYVYDGERERLELFSMWLNEQLPPVQPISRWIPVSEKLPKEGKTVIASTKYGVYPEAKYTKEYGWEWAYEAGADYWVELENVTAWMPLPESYDPKESEGRA